MSIELGRRLLASGVVRAADLRTALFLHATTRTPLVAALIEVGAMSEAALESELDGTDTPTVDHVEPVPALIDELPVGICNVLYAVPIRRDERTGAVDVAVVDPYDSHVAAELGFHMQSQIRVLRAPLAVVVEALRRIDVGEYSSRVIVQRRASTVPPSRLSEPILLTRRRRKGDTSPPGRARGRGSRPPLSAVDASRRSGVPPSLRPPAVPRFDEPPPGARVVRASSVFPPSVFAASSPTAGAADARGSIPPPETTRGPFSPAAPVAPFPEIDGILSSMHKAGSRDRVVELVLAGARTVAARVALFSVRGSELRGYACNAAFGEREAFRAVRILASSVGILSQAIDEGIYLGPLQKGTADDILLEFMGNATDDVAAAPVRIVGKPALVLVADDLGDTLIATRRIDDLTKTAGHALARLLHAEKTGRG